MDRDRRSLEREASQGDAHAASRLLLLRVRCGDLDREQLSLASLLGDPIAREAHEQACGQAWNAAPLTGWARQIAMRGQMLTARVALAAAREAIPHWEMTLGLEGEGEFVGVRWNAPRYIEATCRCGVSRPWLVSGSKARFRVVVLRAPRIEAPWPRVFRGRCDVCGRRFWAVGALDQTQQERPRKLLGHLAAWCECPCFDCHRACLGRIPRTLPSSDPMSFANVALALTTPDQPLPLLAMRLEGVLEQTARLATETAVRMRIIQDVVPWVLSPAPALA